MGQWLIAGIALLDALAALDGAGHRHYPALVYLRLGDAVAFAALAQSSSYH
jgi:hypothetical protein